MNPAEAADTIQETAEEQAHHAREQFRNRAALVIAVLAALLAVCELLGDNAKDLMIYNNIKASDSWAFYQAKNQRQTAYKLAGDEIRRSLADPALAPAARPALQADLDRYEATVARYEDEPSPAAPHDATKGEGKKQLAARAESFETAREVATERTDNYNYAQMVLQLAIVLGSVSILALSRPLLVLSGGLGVLGLVLLANGVWLVARLPG